MIARFLHSSFTISLLLSLAACGGGGGGGDKPAAGSGPVIASSITASSSSAAPLDTDKDGHPDTQDAFPNNAAEWLDTDKDGVGDNGDIFPNDPKEMRDTDKDGVGDNGDAFPNDPSETLDTDKDGIGNNKDLFPQDPTEWADTDKDGIGDNNDTSPMGPAIPGWTTFQGNNEHSGNVDITLKPELFKSRWSKQELFNSPSPIVAGDGYIFFTSSDGVLRAINAYDGTTRWTYQLHTNNPPAYANGIVYVQTGQYVDSAVTALDARDGRIVFQSQLPFAYGSYVTPTIFEDSVYLGSRGWDGINTLNAKTGASQWSVAINRYNQFTPTVNSAYLIAYSSDAVSQLTVLNRSTNKTVHIPVDNFYWTSPSETMAPVIAGESAFAIINNYLLHFDLAQGTLAWKLQGKFAGQPVVRDSHVYVINNGVIEARNQSDGAVVSTITGSSEFIGNLLVTNNLVIVRDSNNIYAYDLATLTKVWTLENQSGEFIMAEGALIVLTNKGITAIDLEGDMDADGIPDWWEKRYQKNFAPAADLDNDGLSNQEEFTHNTQPFVADMDDDGLLDGEEIKTHLTSPANPDSDADGLTDNAEVKTHLTNPNQYDSDGDLLTDADEIAAGLNPLLASDATKDFDGDGHSNIYEIQANTNINDANSYPVINDWAMEYSNAKHNSYIPLILDSSNFKLRWSNNTSALAIGSTGKGKIFLTDNKSKIVALDSGNGDLVWDKQFNSVYNISAPAFNNGNIFFQSYEIPGIKTFAVDATTGVTAYEKATSQQSRSSLTPTLYNDQLLSFDYANTKVVAYSLNSGDLQWSTNSFSFQTYENTTVSAADNKVFVGAANQLNAYATDTGNNLFAITLPQYTNTEMTVIGSRNNLLTKGMHITNVDLGTGRLIWQIPSKSMSYFFLAAGNNKVYATTNNTLSVFNEQTGKLEWSWTANDSFASNLVITTTHAFIASDDHTYAIDLNSRKLAWSFDEGGRKLAIGKEGALFVSNYNKVFAIELEGDTDSDGIPQWWERKYGGDLTASADLDSDGLTNTQEFNVRTNPLVADTDNDGINDNAELNTHNTNPLVSDSDGDGIKDGDEVNLHSTNPLVADTDEDGLDDFVEIAAGLHPDDDDDASGDNDNDGFSNKAEINASTDLNNAASRPAASDWGMIQANASHNGFQPLLLDSDNFTLRWNIAFDTTIRQVATHANNVFAVQSDYSKSRVTALNVQDARSQWEHTFDGVNSLGTVSVKDNLVYLHSGGYETAALSTLNASTGASVFSRPYTGQWLSYSAPTLFDAGVYMSGDNYWGIQAINAATGVSLWSHTSQNTSYDWEPAVNAAYVFQSNGYQIIARDRATGNEAFSLATEKMSRTPVLGSRNNLLVTGTHIQNFDLATQKELWRTTQSNIHGIPAVGNQSVYFMSEGTLFSVNELNGNLRWSWKTEEWLNSNIVVTLSHIFVSTSTNTYALAVTTGEVEWTYNKGGVLSLGRDEALYISTGTQLYAINLGGDTDGDGMPDWWEAFYGLDIHDSADAALDLDNDGLTNLLEFTHKSDAANNDTDGDTLSDYVEVVQHLTSPISKDTDQDGMPDVWEINANLNPIDAADKNLDADGDSVSNYFEFIEASDPNDALSLPTPFPNGITSFEDNQLPARWSLSNQSTNVSITTDHATDGTHSLETRSAATINFEGFFATSELSIDIKAYCNNSSENLEVYVDNQRINSTLFKSQWSTLKTVIPAGRHKISLRTDNYDNQCPLYLDKVVIEPVKSNAQLGVQFIALDYQTLHFVDVDGTTVRSVDITNPPANNSPVAVATLGTDKVTALFPGTTPRIGVLDLKTFLWTYWTSPYLLVDNYPNNTNILATNGNNIYVLLNGYSQTENTILRIDASTGAVTRFGSHRYNAIAVGNDGYIYAHSNSMLYKYDPNTLAQVNGIGIEYAVAIAVDAQNKIVVAHDNGRKILRYNQQQLVEARIELPFYTTDLAVNKRGELLVGTSSEGNRWYNADWTRFRSLPKMMKNIDFVTHTDADSDSIPDWWELKFGLNLNDASDATSDSDADGLDALAEYNHSSNPNNTDTDGDLLSDGDEVLDFATNPNTVDSDGDGISDADEVLVQLTNPLLKDTDGDQFNDGWEVSHFHTNPIDATSKPASFSNYTHSFENGLIDWTKPEAAAGGWSIVNDAASDGSKSLRSNNVAGYASAEIEWSAVFVASTLSFDAKVSSAACCDRLEVYVDNQLTFANTIGAQWQTINITLPAGEHNIRWVYQRGYDYTLESQHNAWIDKITLH